MKKQPEERKGTFCWKVGTTALLGAAPRTSQSHALWLPRPLAQRAVSKRRFLGAVGTAFTFSGNADSFSHLATLLDSKGPNWVRLTSCVTANTPSAPSSSRLISKLEGRDDLKK